ncbi:MAG: hypothetical protein ACFFEF_04730 [Candidatus Thorarchaeota archaeon]
MIHTSQNQEATMMQMDAALFYLIWWIVPLAILFGRAALEADKARKRRNELRALEERVTPFTRDL